jgi:hypothetical protein
MTWNPILLIDPQFGKRYPPNIVERPPIALVKALTRLLAWLAR